MAVSVTEYKAMLASGGSAGKQTAKQSKRKKNPEYDIQARYVEDMAKLYPDVMVFSDTAAHIKKTMIQQKRANRLSTGVKWPDVFVAQPSGAYSGLYLEFKAESPFKQDGTLKKNEHVEAQAKCLEMLMKRGYLATFVWTVEDALSLTKRYLEHDKRT